MVLDWTLALLALVGAALALLGQFVPEKRKTLRLLLSGGGGLLAAGVAFFATIQQARYSERIETLTEQTHDLVTGGKSYVWVYAQKYPFTSADKNLFLLAATQGGDLVPAFDVNIEFETTGQCDGVLSTNPGRSGPRDLRRAYFPAVTSKVSMYPIQTFLNPTCDEAFYLATIHTRNRVFTQQTILKKVEGNWKVFVRLIDAETDKLVHAFPSPEAIKAEKWAAPFPSLEDARKLREALRAGRVAEAGE
jgi:hypothetical protein